MIYAADIILPITSAPVENGAILVKGGRIAAVGARDPICAQHAGEEVTDFGNAILMPGLVNLHGHLECASFGFLAGSGSFEDWLGGIIKAGRQMDKDAWLAAARSGVRKYLKAGITCTADITRSGASLAAIAEVKMPAIVYLEAVAVDEGNLSDALVELLENIETAQTLAEIGGFRVGLSPHSPYTLSLPALKACSELSRQYNLPLTIHLAETKSEVELVRDGSGSLANTVSQRLKLEAINHGGLDKTPAELLADIGLIADNTLLAHGVWLSDSDIELLKAKRAALALCPTSNELLQVGEAPVAKLIDSSLAIGIGTDSCASNPELDLFVEARKVRELFLKQRSELGNKSGTKAKLSAQDLIEMITINAARILGLDSETGSIEPGKRADLIAVGLDSFRPASPYDSYDYLIKNASSSLISHTILAGRAVKA